LPLPALLVASQLGLPLVADQEQPAPAVTVAVPLPPALVKAGGFGAPAAKL